MTSPTSLRLYALLTLLTVVTALIGPLMTGPAIRLFGLYEVLLVALGGVGLYIAPRTGFADLIDSRVSNWQRWGRPALVGLAFGLADWLVYTLVIHPEPVTALTPFMQPFPYSVLLYGSGALYVEVLYRLIPIPLLLWFIGGLLLHDPQNERLFWVLAGLTSLIEPLDQLITDSPGLIAYSFGTGYAMNLVQALFFRWYGFGAGLSVRLGHYALWHVGFGWWVELAQS